MSYPRCFSLRDLPARIRATLALAAALALAGCAGAPVADDDGAGGEMPAAQSISPEAETLFEQAVAVMAAGDFVEAEFRLKEFVLQYPDYPGAHANLAIIHAANGDDAAAEGSITDALIADPAHAPSLNQLGMLLRRQGRFDDAEAAYLRAVEADPGYELAWYNLGVLNDLYLRRLDAAVDYFQTYQLLHGGDEQVEKWIVDLKRRLEAEQRAANVTE